jgi:hypothetical protein
MAGFCESANESLQICGVGGCGGSIDNAERESWTAPSQQIGHEAGPLGDCANFFSCVTAGWRRSGDRTCLEPNSLLTGNLTGKAAIPKPKERILEHKAAVSQRLIKELPVQINREYLSKIKEIFSRNRGLPGSFGGMTITGSRV